MTYHKKTKDHNERLICHHCGKIEKVPTLCPKCKSPYIKYIGLGTQKIETEIKKLYKNARIIRADKDTTTKKDSFSKIYKTFKEGKADILIGTQMIGLGLHLPKVNLVGIILADMGLNIPDFRSSEKTFQLISQVGGRAGRDKKQGTIIIQTYSPNNYAIKLSAQQNYNKFYEQEIKIRQTTNNPPFKKIIKITIKDKEQQKCERKAEEIYDKLISLNKNKTNEITYFPSITPKINNQYIWHILITGENPQELIKKIDTTNLIIDIDPTTTT